MLPNQAAVDAARLIALRKARGWSGKRLAGEAELDQSVVSRIETGKAKNPTHETVSKLANALGVPISAISRVAASEDPDVREPASAGVDVGVAVDGDYSEGAEDLEIVRITGDCLQGVIDHGDEAHYKPTKDWQSLKPGNIVVVRHHGELLCKRVAKDRDGWLLIADNGIVIHPDETTELQGIVRKVTRTLN